MSETLRVTLDGHQLLPSDETEIQEVYRTAANAVITPSMASSIRLVIRSEPHGTTIEPFLGSASFEALLRVAKKRDDAFALLVMLVACALLFCDRVGVLLIEEGSPLPQKRTELSVATFRERRRLTSAWYRIVAPFTWFHISQVEAKLLQPLNLPNGQVATHYFRDFWVRAIEHQVAYAAVAMTVAKDAARVVAFGDIAPGDPPLQSDDGGNVATGGRVYFSDRSH